MRELLKSKLNELSTHIEGQIPTTLDLEAQSEFALGYYQMGAKMEKEIREFRASKAEMKEV